MLDAAEDACVLKIAVDSLLVMVVVFNSLMLSTHYSYY